MRSQVGELNLENQPFAATRQRAVQSLVAGSRTVARCGSSTRERIRKSQQKL
jgi:hypothetical protein